MTKEKIVDNPLPEIKAKNPFQLIYEFLFPTPEAKKEQETYELRKKLRVIEGGKK